MQRGLDIEFADLDAGNYVGTFSFGGVGDDGARFQFSDVDATGGTLGLVMTAQYVVVPEPTTLALSTLGLMGLFGGTRRRRSL